MAVPTDIANCTLWLKRETIAALSDGTGISSWSDSSGAGNNASQGTAANRPVKQTVDGKAVARATGASTHFMTFAGDPFRATAGSAFTLFWVSKWTSGGTQFLIAKDDDSLGREYAIGFDGGNAIYEQRGGSIWMAGAAVTEDFHTFAYEVDVAAITRSYVDGSALQTRNEAFTGNASTAAPNLFRRSYSGFNNPWTGDLMEMWAFNRRLTATEIAQMNDYGASLLAAGGAQPKTFYIKDALASGSNHLSLQDGGSAPSAARIITGWIVGTLTPTRYALMDSQTERASAAHTTTIQPSAAPDDTLGDCFRSENPLTGSFAAGNWSFSFEVQGETRATSTHDGRLRLRVWTSPNADGSAGTAQVAAFVTSAYTDLANSAVQTITATWNASAFSVTNEYVFVQVAHELTGAGNNSNSDTHLRVGPANSVTTTAFSVAAPHQITASGVATTVGSAAATLTQPLQASAAGAGTTVGAASASVVKVASASGAATTDGTASFVLTLSASASASTTGAASAAVTSQLAASASGAATSAGAAALAPMPLAAAGQGASGGSAAADLVRILEVSASGAASSTGTAATEILSGAVTHQLSASGATSTAGTAAVTRLARVTAQGIATTTGSALLAALVRASASGVTSPTGSASIATTAVLSAAGGATTAGSAAVTAVLPVTAAGTAATTGTASLGAGTGLTASGSSATTAGAVVSLAVRLTATGLATTGGTATTEQVYRVGAAGTASTTGTALVVGTLGVSATAWATTSGTATAVIGTYVSADGMAVTAGSAQAFLVTDLPDPHPEHVVFGESVGVVYTERAAVTYTESS